MQLPTDTLPDWNGHASSNGHVAPIDSALVCPNSGRRSCGCDDQLRSRRLVTSTAESVLSGTARLSHTGKSNTSCLDACRCRTAGSSTVRRGLCQAIKATDGSAGGLTISRPTRSRTRSWFSSIAGQLNRNQIIEILETALVNAEHPAQRDKLDVHLPVCTALVPIAAARAQFAVPVLLPAAAVMFAYASIPTFKSEREVLVEEKRARRRCAGRDRGRRMSGYHGDFSGSCALLVLELRSSPGQEDTR